MDPTASTADAEGIYPDRRREKSVRWDALRPA